jgi:hypothetical protein
VIKIRADGEVLVNSDLSSTLAWFQGPVFRFSFALMVLGFLRMGAQGATEAAVARLMLGPDARLRAKLRLRATWFLFPHRLLDRDGRMGAGWSAYHAILALFSLVFRLGAVIVPAFMVAHVYLWERGLGLSWPSLPPGTANYISLLTIATGLAVFFGRLYSPLLRRFEPPRSFLKPLVLVAPFATGVLATHPTWSPISYQAVMLLHTLSACLVFVMLPFGRILSFMHTPVTRWVPEACWRYAPGGPAPRPAAARELVSA